MRKVNKRGVTYTCRGWSSCGGSAWARGRAGCTVATQLKVYANVIRRKRAADGRRRRSRTVAAISRSHGVLWRPTIDLEINTGRREVAARLPPPAHTTTPPHRSLPPRHRRTWRLVINTNSLTRRASQLVVAKGLVKIHRLQNKSLTITISSSCGP